MGGVGGAPMPAGGTTPTGSTMAALIGRLPDSVDLVVAVQDAKDLRTSTLGMSAAAFLDDSGSLNELAEAWSSLAAELGWTQTETFDRLMGKRVMLVSKGLPGQPVVFVPGATGASSGGASSGTDILAQERRWMLVCEVTTDTDAHFRRQLQASPRAMTAGHQILSLEKGRYELVTHRPDVEKSRGGGAPNASDTVLVLLAPSGKSELLDEVVLVLAEGAAAPLSKRPVHARLAQLGDAEVLVLADLSRGPGAMSGMSGQGNASGQVPVAAQEPWSAFVAFGGQRDDGPIPEVDGAVVGGAASASGATGPRGGGGLTWRSRVVVKSTEPDSALQVASESDAPFRAARTGSLLAVMHTARLPQVLGASMPLETLLGQLPLPERAKPLTTDRQAVMIRAVGPEARLCCTVAMFTPSTHEFAQVMDGSIARGVQAFEQRLGVSAPAPPDYGGAAPGAARVLPIESGNGGALALLTGRPLVVSWCYASRPMINGPYNVARSTMSESQLREALNATPSPSDQSRPGWWVMSVCQALSDARESQSLVSGALSRQTPIGQSTTTASSSVLQLAGADGSATRSSGTSQATVMTSGAESKVVADGVVDVGSLSPTPAEVVRNEANALLNTDSSGEVARWLALGWARPAMVDAMLPSSIPDFRGWRSMMRRVDVLDVRLKLTDDGDIAGDITLRFTPQTSQPPQTPGSNAVGSGVLKP